MALHRGPCRGGIARSNGLANRPVLFDRPRDHIVELPSARAIVMTWLIRSEIAVTNCTK